MKNVDKNTVFIMVMIAAILIAAFCFHRFVLCDETYVVINDTPPHIWSPGVAHI